VYAHLLLRDLGVKVYCIGHYQKYSGMLA